MTVKVTKTPRSDGYHTKTSKVRFPDQKGLNDIKEENCSEAERRAENTLFLWGMNDICLHYASQAADRVSDCLAKGISPEKKDINAIRTLLYSIHRYKRIPPEYLKIDGNLIIENDESHIQTVFRVGESYEKRFPDIWKGTDFNTLKLVPRQTLTLTDALYPRSINFEIWRYPLVWLGTTTQFTKESFYKALKLTLSDNDLKVCWDHLTMILDSDLDFKSKVKSKYIKRELEKHPDSLEMTAFFLGNLRKTYQNKKLIIHQMIDDKLEPPVLKGVASGWWLIKRNLLRLDSSQTTKTLNNLQNRYRIAMLRSVPILRGFNVLNVNHSTKKFYLGAQGTRQLKGYQVMRDGELKSANIFELPAELID